MVKKSKKNENTVKETVNQENIETETTTSKSIDKNPEIFSRIFYTILFALISWVTIWVFAFVVLIQFGFLLITGKVNKNLKGFNQEVGLFLYDMIKYLSFQTNNKPFPFRDWPYGDEIDSENKNELNTEKAVKANK